MQQLTNLYLMLPCNIDVTANLQNRYFSLLLGQDAQCCGHGGSSHPCNFIVLGYITKNRNSKTIKITIMTTLRGRAHIT